MMNRQYRTNRFIRRIQWTTQTNTNQQTDEQQRRIGIIEDFNLFCTQMGIDRTTFMILLVENFLKTISINALSLTAPNRNIAINTFDSNISGQKLTVPKLKQQVTQTQQ